MARIHAVQAIFLLKCALYPYEPAVPSTSDSQRNLEGTVSKCVYSERQRRAVHNFLFIYLLDCMSETDSRPSCHSTLDVRLVSARVDTATSASGSLVWSLQLRQKVWKRQGWRGSLLVQSVHCRCLVYLQAQIQLCTQIDQRHFGPGQPGVVGAAFCAPLRTPCTRWNHDQAQLF